MRINQRKEFVIGGYTPSLKNLDALVIGNYDGKVDPRGAHVQGAYADLARSAVQKPQAARITEMPVYKFVREEGRG